MSRVLVVDDDPEILSILVEALESAGHETIYAINGREALEQLDEAPPDLILTDLVMPIMDGWRFIEQCRDRPSCREIPVLVISAFVQPSEVTERMERLGVRQCLTKPFDLDEVLADVDTLTAEPPRQTSAV